MLLMLLNTHENENIPDFTNKASQVVKLRQQKNMASSVGLTYCLYFVGSYEYNSEEHLRNLTASFTRSL